MKYRKLGRTDIKVSEIGFGCQSIGGGFYYKDDKESLETLFEAFDSGINFYDTSDHYTQGESEILIGRAFKGKRDKIIIATKAGTLYSPAADFLLRKRSWLRPISRYMHSLKIPFHLMRARQKRSDFSSAYLTSAVEKSLKRLRTDYVDLFQLHKPSRAVLERGDFVETLEKLKQQGKIRYYGVSCAENEDAFICFNYSEISSLQVTFNLLNKKFIDEILINAQRNGVGIIGRNPRAQGHLTSGLSDIMAETYARNKKEFNMKKEKAGHFKFLVNKDRSLTQAALRYVLSFNGVSTALPRAVNRKQLHEILGTLNSPPLSCEELENIRFMENQKVFG